MELTFKNVLRALKKDNNYSEILNLTNNITSLLILCSISVINPTAAIVASISHSLLLKDKVSEIGKSLISHFKKFHSIDTSTFEIAYVLIHFTSFFDTLLYRFPELLKEIELTEPEKMFIINKKKDPDTPNIDEIANFDNYESELANYKIDLISNFNILTPDIYLSKLIDKLAEGFIDFIQRLAIWDNLNETRQEKLCNDIKNLKAASLKKFENQLITLSAEIEGFYEWLSRTEHKELSVSQKKIHVKLQDIENLIKNANPSTPEELKQFIDNNIEKIKLRIRKKKLEVSLDDIQEIEENYWEKLTPKQKFILKSLKAEIYLLLSEIDKASDLLIESYQYYKNNEKALFNVAYGYYLKKDFENALKFNDKILKKYPENADANTIKILLTDLKVSTIDLIKSIPESLFDIPKISFHIAEFARNKKEYETAFKWYEKSIQTENESTFEIKAIYAKSLIEFVLKNDKFFNRIQLPEKLRENLEYANRLLNDSWDYVKNSEIQELHVDWLSDIALINHLLNDSDKALKIINKALEINSHDTRLNRNKAVILYEIGRINDSIPYFEKVLNQDPISDIVFNFALAYSRLDKNEKAIGILLEYLKQNIPNRNKIIAERTLFDLYCKTNNLKQAEEVLDKYTDLKYKKIDYSKIFTLQGKTKEALNILNELENDIIEDMDTKDIFELANGYYSIKEYKKASKYYEFVVDLNKYNPMLNRYIESLLKGEKKEEAYKICENIRKNEGFISDLFSIETTILEQIGDLDKTIEIYKDALASKPNDYQLLLNLAIYYMKKEDKEGIKTILEYAFKFDQLTLEEGFQLVYLYAENDQIEKAFMLIYELRRKFYYEESAHLKYAGFFFSYSNMFKEQFKLIDLDEVSINCAVLIGENGNTKTYVLDNRKDADLIKLKEINETHPLYKLLLNKRKNDEFEIDESPFSMKSMKILDVMHKYAFAFRETLDIYNYYFPNANGMYKISLKLPNDDSAKMEDINPILKGADELQEKTNYFENLYKSNPVPISFISKQSGFNIFDILFGFGLNEDIGIRCCAGDEDERQKALNSIKIDKTLVLDMVSIFTIHHLKIFEIIKSKFNLVISQSTIDELDEIIKERKFSVGKEVITIGKVEEQYTKILYSAEQNTKYYNSLIKLKKWLIENCNIKACKKRFDFDENKILKLEKTIGKSFIDSILLACDEDTLLLTDDLYIRKIAEDVFKINGIWLQVLLIYLNDNNVLSETEYQKNVIELVCMNYHHTSINYKTILNSAKLSHFNLVQPLSKVLSILNGNKCNEISALRVVDKTMYSLYSEVMDKVVCTTLINGLLDSSTEYRDAKNFVHSLMAGATVVYRLHPIYLKFILGLLRAWLKSRFLF